MDLKIGLTPAPKVKLMINIGALFDITTGTFIEGMRGEYLLNGGRSPLEGYVGIGNSFKTTVMQYTTYRAMSRFDESTGSTYDAEVNRHEDRMITLANKAGLDGEELFASGRYVLTDETLYYGNEWYEKHKEFLKRKRKNEDKLKIATPFWNRDRTAPFQMLYPTFGEVDSFTEFKTEDVVKMQDDNELGDSGGNTIHMRQGLAKTRFLMEAPGLNCGAYNYLAMTAHLGKESAMNGMGPTAQPVQKLKSLKNGDKIKGVTDKFTFATLNCWNMSNAKPLMADDRNGPKYPRNADDKLRLDTDLMEVTVVNLRGKSGPTGQPFQILVSQSEGVKPSLTEYNYLRDQGNPGYGLEGSAVSHWLYLYPERRLGRTIVRELTETDPKLQRALLWTSQMCQMKALWHDLLPGFLVEPKVLYEDLKAMGYNWEQLYNTRDWWCPLKEEALHAPYLSTYDLLRMRMGHYVPFWFTDDEFAKIKLTDEQRVKLTAKRAQNAQLNLEQYQ